MSWHNCHRPRLRTFGYFRPRPLHPLHFDPGRQWRFGFAVLSVCLCFIYTRATILAPSNQLREAGVAAFQAFARPGVGQSSLRPAIEPKPKHGCRRGLRIPSTFRRLPPAVRLVGARIAPYSGNPAAFLAYKSQERPLGLLIQSLDAFATSAPRLFAAADGRLRCGMDVGRSQGFALVGDLDAGVIAHNR